MNCDYKIAAKAIANRLRNVIPKIINNDQTGFLKGRFISENIRLIHGIINHTESNKIPGLLLFLDFEKAFDTVEWPSIWKHWTRLISDHPLQIGSCFAIKI